MSWAFGSTSGMFMSKTPLDVHTYASLSTFLFFMVRSLSGDQSVYIGGLLYNSAIAPVKVAILIEWARIFAPRTRNAFWWLCHTVLALNVVWYTIATIVEALQCTPPSKIWDPTVLEGSCLNTRTVEVVSSSINVVSDFVILIAPQPIIWRLQLPLRKKIGVAMIFAVGLL
jgi:hypothetical protein